MYDAAAANTLLEKAVAAENKQIDAQTLMKSVVGIATSTDELSGKIKDLAKEASDLSKAAGGAHDTAESLHDAVNPDFSPNGILLNL